MYRFVKLSVCRNISSLFVNKSCSKIKVGDSAYIMPTYGLVHVILEQSWIKLEINYWLREWICQHLSSYGLWFNISSAYWKLKLRSSSLVEWHGRDMKSIGYASYGILSMGKMMEWNNITCNSRSLESNNMYTNSSFSDKILQMEIDSEANPGWSV